eukprot:1007628-Pyramimonas_sp.AAC.1
MAKRARSRSRSTTPTRRDTHDDFDAKLRRAQAQDEEQKCQDLRLTLVAAYLTKRADGLTDSAARG